MFFAILLSVYILFNLWCPLDIASEFRLRSFEEFKIMSLFNRCSIYSIFDELEIINLVLVFFSFLLSIIYLFYDYKKPI
jgi:hypothetical protein